MSVSSPIAMAVSRPVDEVVAGEPPVGRLMGGHRGVGDRRPGRLERGDDLAVRPERAGFACLGLVDPFEPEPAAILRQPGQPVPQVADLAGQDGVPDGQAPQRAGLTGERVGVGQRTRPPVAASTRACSGRRGGPARPAPVRISDPFPAVWPVRCVQCARRGPRSSLGRARVGGDGAEDLAGLVADVGGAAGVPVGRSRRRSASSASSVRRSAPVAGDLGDGPGLRGVVGPLARREAAESAADHLRAPGQRRGPELVAGAERVARRRRRAEPRRPGRAARSVSLIRPPSRRCGRPGRRGSRSWPSGSRSSSSRHVLGHERPTR